MFRLKIIPVDLAQKTNSPEDIRWATSPEGLSIRNKAMAKKIAELRSARDCRKMILIAGNAHVSKMNWAEVSLPEALVAKGIKPYSINFMTGGSTLFGYGEDRSFRWTACKNNPVPPATVRAFKNDEFPRDMMMTPGSGDRSGRFAEFDLSVVYPDNRPKLSDYNK